MVEKVFLLEVTGSCCSCCSCSLPPVSQTQGEIQDFIFELFLFFSKFFEFLEGVVHGV